MQHRHADLRLSSEKLVFHKVHFTVRKRVKFGQAVYVCGSRPEIGLWHPEKAFRLKWNEGDTWTGTLLLMPNIPPCIEFKYMISSWESPSSHNCQWEIGDHNRKADLSLSKSLTFIDDKWNIDQISLYLITKRPKHGQAERYYVTGSIPQLGNWKDRRLMKKNLNSYIANHFYNKEWENIIQYSPKDNQLWAYSFDIFRLQTDFFYYYMRSSDFTQTERKPGRIFQFNHQQTHYPSRRRVLHPRGDIVIIDQSSIDEIKLSKITSSIYVGNYVKTVADLQKLKKNHITTILSIQSERDYKKNGVSSYYLETICRQHDIELKTCSIQDMNKKDFITHAEEGVRIMDQALAKGGKIYVHCTAGIYRSPQMIALYLVAIKKYNIQDAVALLKERHSYAKPSFKTIQEALNVMERKNKGLLRV